MATDRQPQRTHGDWPFDRIVVPSPEELRFADQLRVQIRERFLDMPVPMPLPWCVSAD
jgi:hypothetical protein